MVRRRVGYEVGTVSHVRKLKPWPKYILKAPMSDILSQVEAKHMKPFLWSQIRILAEIKKKKNSNCYPTLGIRDEALN